MKDNQRINISLTIGILIFLAVIVLTKLFKISDLPLQTIGAMFGAVITALITYFLLIGQSKAEETKERNVKIFEKRTESYEHFIKKLWDVWEDRKVTPEELNELLEYYTKDILLYSSKRTSKNVLNSLKNISDDIEDFNTKIDLQKEIFNIIDALIQEIGLGGKLDNQTREQIKELEQKILPHIIKEKYLKGLIENLKNNDIFSFGEISFHDDYSFLKCQILNSKVELHIGGFSENILKSRFVVNKFNKEYDAFREGKSGQAIWRQETIKSSWKENWKNNINFKDNSSIEIMNLNYSEKDYFQENKLAKEIIEFCENWKNEDGKSILNIINECENK